MRRLRLQPGVLMVILAGVAVISVGALVSLSASAQTTSFSIEDIGSSIGLGSADLRQTVINILQWVLGILGLVAVSFIIYGGVLWMTANGRQERIDKAKRVILSAVIGLVIVLIAWAIVLFVARFITGSTGGSGVTCNPGDVHPTNVCFECNSAGTGYVAISPAPAGCTVTSAQFTLLDVDTAHGGSFSYDDVYLCSSTQARFNQRVLADSINNNPDLKITRASDGESVIGTWTTAGDSIVYKQGSHCQNNPSQTCTTDSECGGSTCGKLLEPNTNYTAHFPKSIKNTSNDFLKACSAAGGCADNGTEYTWNFHTGTDTDSTAPTVTSTYPISSGTGYPDRNVSRQPKLEISFSEAIDMTSVIDSNNSPHPINGRITIEQLDGQGGSVVGTIDPNVISVSAKSLGFRFSLDAPNALEPFAWYRVTVQGIEDLCGNGIAAPKVWEFQTNDAVAGVASVYPTGTNQCPDTNIMFTFGTSMWDQTVQLTVAGSGAPLVINMPAPSSFASGPYERTIANVGTLRIKDTNTAPVDNNFRVYEFIPASSLADNTTYTVTVDTDLVINTSGTKLSHQWQFAVSDASKCSCKPYVARFNPDQGPRGMCVSIIGQCFNGTTAHPATVTDLKYGTDLNSPVAGTIGGSTPTTVTSFVPTSFNDGDRVKARVTITYDDAAYGTQSGDSTNDFFVNSSVTATGPCLFSLTPDHGQRGTGVTATGIRFGDAPPAQTLAQIHFENGSGGATAGWTSWSDTQIKTTVPPFAIDGDVDVHNDAGVSNPVFFDVTFPPPSSPQVLGHWPTCDKACLNAAMGAQFNIEMDGPTISPTSVLVRRCTTSACDVFDQNVSIGPVNYTYDAATKLSQADWAPTGAFDAGRWYRVIMLNTIAAPDGGTISNLNYDNNGDSTDDSFSWVFQTGTENCSVDRIQTQPLTYTFSTLGARKSFMSTAYGQPDSCNAQGQPLNQSLFTWAWSTSNAGRVAVGGDTDNTTDATSVAETVPNPPVSICTRIPTESVQSCAQVVVDLAHCNETKDCTDPDGDGTAQCNGSTCDDVTKRCTPIVTTLNPNQGPVGQWATVGGCYFGGYQANRCSGGNNALSCATDADCGGGTCVGSRVIFTDKKLGQLPAICGPAGTTWSDSSIVVEVPNAQTASDTTDDATTGPVTVIRASDKVSAVSSGNFSVISGTPGPGICYATPDRGPVQTLVTLVGKNFGTRDPANDKVVFYDNQEGTNIATWSDTSIQVRVPNGATTNNDQTHPWYPGEISVLKGTVWSNAVNYSVETNSCANSCAVDSECTAVLGAGYGCSATGCCAPAPSVTTTIPVADATGVCRNSMVEVNFDMPMAGSTLNANNVTLSYVITGKTKFVTPTSVTRDTDTIRLTYGLLEPSTRYTVTVSNAVTNTSGVHMAANRSWAFFTQADTAANSGVCQLASVHVVPTAVSLSAQGQTQTLTAQGYDNQNNPLTPVPGVYDWTWSWASSDPAVATVASSTSDTSVTAAVANGKTLATATATSGTGWTGTKTGIASVEVDFCENPWNFVDAANNCVVGSCDEDFHMMTHYCRDSSSGTLLPDLLRNIPIRGKITSSSTLMKQYLFKHPDAEDGIGIRVFDNPTLLSVRDWYNQQVPNPGNVSEITVDGYPALRDGTSVYVGVANLDGSTLKGRIVLISYNSGAAPEIQTIFNSLVNNFRFNTNVSGACSVNPPLENKVCIARDLKRINDLHDIATKLDNFRAETSATSSSNLAKNSGFESATGSNTPDNWSFGSRDGSVKHNGNFSVKLNASNYTYQDVPVQFGKQYIISGWIKTDLDAVTHPGGKALITTECLDGSHAVDTSSNCSLNHTDGTGLNGQRDWTRQSFVIEADKANRPYVRISCYNGPSGAATLGSIWCDDITVVAGSSLYPDLTAGSFISGMSVSRWPQSWNSTLGNALKTGLATDPLNTLENCPAGYDQTACWDDATSTFYCDPTSHVYGYTSDSGANYTLYANLEYEDTGSWREGSVAGVNICNDGRSSCSCFDYDVASP